MIFLFLIQIFVIQVVMEQKLSLGLPYTFPTNPAISQIYGMQLSSSQKYIYISSLDVDLINRVRQYDKTTVNGTQNWNLNKILVSEQGFSNPNKIIEINSEYLIVYSNLDQNYEIFNLTSGLSIAGYSFSQTTIKIIYSKAKNQLIVMRKTGKVQVFPFNQFLLGDFSNSFYFLNGPDDYVDGELSPDEYYLAVKTDGGNVYIFDMFSLTQLMCEFITNLGLQILWDSSSTWTFLLDESNGALLRFDYDVGSSYLGTIPLPLDIYVYKMIYNKQTSQLVLIYSQNSDKYTIIVQVYDLASFRSNYTFLIGLVGFKQFSSQISYRVSNSSGEFYLLIWQLNQIQRVTITMNTSLPISTNNFMIQNSQISVSETKLSSQIGETTTKYSTTTGDTLITDVLILDSNATVSDNRTAADLLINGTVVGNISSKTPDSLNTLDSSNTSLIFSNITNISANDTGFVNSTNANDTSLVNSTNANDTSLVNSTSNINQLTINLDSVDNSTQTVNISQTTININETNLNTQINNEQQSQSVANYQSLVQNSLNSTFLQVINKIPSSRKLLKPIFSFFTNFDDLWLYNYHQRNYQTVLTTLFQSIQQVQTEKWNTLPYKNIYSNIFSINITSFQIFLSQQKISYSSSKFISIENNSNGYFVNTLNFYFETFILLIFIFCMGKLAYFLLNKCDYKFKMLFIQFSFTLYFFVASLQGNVQYMAYLFGFQMNTLFSQTFKHKMLTILTLSTFFLFTFLVISIYYFIVYSYSKKSQTILQNCRPTTRGIFYLTLQFGIRNIMLGFVHILFQSYYTQQILILIFLQITCLMYNIYFTALRGQICFIRKSRQWIILITSFLRILLISTFLIKKNDFFNQNNDLLQVFSETYSAILLLYMILWPFSILLETSNLILQSVVNSKSTKQNKQSIYKVDIKQQQAHVHFNRPPIQLEYKTNIIKKFPLFNRLKTYTAANNQVAKVKLNQKSKMPKVVLIKQMKCGQIIEQQLCSKQLNMKFKVMSHEMNRQMDLTKTFKRKRLKYQNKLKTTHLKIYSDESALEQNFYE